MQDPQQGSIGKGALDGSNCGRNETVLPLPSIANYQVIWGEVDLELNVLKRLKIGHKVHSHLLHEVRKLYMRNIQG